MASGEAAKGTRRRGGKAAGREDDETRKITARVGASAYVRLCTLAAKRRVHKQAIVEEAIVAYLAASRSSVRDADAREEDSVG